MVSIHDVAKEAGVSVSTVSRTFRTPEALRRETRERVMAAVEKSGYRPRRWTASAARRAAASQEEAAGGAGSAIETHETIGFQFFAEWQADTLQTNAFYSSVLAGAQAQADSMGLYMLVNTTDRHRLSEQMPRMIREQAVAGMLLVGTADPEILAAFADPMPNLILVDNRDERDRYDCVLSDGTGGMRAATRYLAEIGHRRIGFVLGDPRVATFQDRLQGYLGMGYQAGLSLDPAWIIAGETIEEITRGLHQCLGLADRPTALLAANDTYALSVLNVCRERGLRVPEDLSLIGFDDVPFISHTTPPLTTLRVDKEQMGRRAVQRLHARLRRDEARTDASDPPMQIVLPVALVHRKSCAPPSL